MPQHHTFQTSLPQALYGRAGNAAASFNRQGPPQESKSRALPLQSTSTKYSPISQPVIKFGEVSSLSTRRKSGSFCAVARGTSAHADLHEASDIEFGQEKFAGAVLSRLASTQSSRNGYCRNDGHGEPQEPTRSKTKCSPAVSVSTPGTTSTQRGDDPAPSGEEELLGYVPLKVHAQRETSEGLQFLIVWEDYPSEADWTWELETNFADLPDLSWSGS